MLECCCACTIYGMPLLFSYVCQTVRRTNIDWCFPLSIQCKHTYGIVYTFPLMRKADHCIWKIRKFWKECQNLLIFSICTRRIQPKLGFDSLTTCIRCSHDILFWITTVCVCIFCMALIATQVLYARSLGSFCQSRSVGCAVVFQICDRYSTS